MDKQAFVELANKVASGLANEQELSLYSNYINQFKGNSEWNTQLMGNEAETKNELLKKINTALIVKAIPFYQKTSFKYLIAACIALVVTAVGAVFYSNNLNSLKNKNKIALENDVAPGGNNAVLTLADGSQVLLNDTDNGKIIEEKGISITKAKDGQLIYRIIDRGANSPSNTEQVIAYNTITTPRGGQYQVLLPDGTQVWLNASSSIKFPTYFSAKQRNVTLTGEAYFEVSKDKTKSFVVNVDEMSVEVLGTHFDVMAYKDEESINTTLLEGSVKVTKNNESRILKPGQQAKVKGGIQVVEAAADVLAWKNGLTSFIDADIRTIMRQVARWYDVEVKYEGDIPRRLFTGEISRKANLSELIKIIKLSNIQLKLEGNVITVMP
ncbi:FecR domain-containing protein [Pedobacter sp. ASV1-7]|uniref:FecR family protein n=1 Tax=Pedobacter sp. ASV1-7 TaxID=3145237 RepID=UPI0032E92E26